MMAEDALNFDGKVAIVTGAGGGLGRCHALELARRGAKVVVNDLGGSVDGSGGSSEAAEKVVEEIRTAGGEAVANGSSVTNDDGVAHMVAQTKEAFGGRIDILVNNAGVLRDKSFAKMEMKDFAFVMDVHLMGTVKCTKAVWEIMREQQYGRIVVTSSSSGLYGNFGQSNYGAAKMGVVGFINTLKLEGQKYNIHANALAPVAWTRMTSNLMPPEMEAVWTPESVSPAVVFMCSDDAPNGQIICAGGGAFAAAALVETEGLFLGKEATAEDVAAQWKKISDLASGRPLLHGGEQGAKFAQLMQKA